MRLFIGTAAFVPRCRSEPGVDPRIRNISGGWNVTGDRRVAGDRVCVFCDCMSARVDRLPRRSRLLAPSRDGSVALRDMRVLAVCGSLKGGSGNLALLKTAAALMPPGVDVVFFEGLGDLPHFNPDLEASGVPESVARWRRALSESDAVLVATPEYGFSLPGALKNAIDWVIGSGELERKVVAITAATTGSDRGRRGLQALRETLSAVRATIVGGEPIPTGAG